MNNQILKVPIEKLTIGTINKLSSNSVGIFKSHFEQFITTQPGMMDLLNHICQSLTYNDSKSVENVTKDFQVWISNSEIFRLAHEADLVIAKAIATIKDSCFREHFVKVLNNVYESIVGDCDADMLKIFVELLGNYYLKDVVDMTLSDKYKTDEILFSYGNYMMDLCFSFEIMALFAGFRLRKMGVNDFQEMTNRTKIKQIIGNEYSSRTLKSRNLLSKFSCKKSDFGLIAAALKCVATVCN